MCAVSGRKSSIAPRAQLRLPAAAADKQLRPPLGQRVVQRYEQLQRLGGQDLVIPLSGGPVISTRSAIVSSSQVRLSS